MKRLQQFNQAIEYIENNLTGDISYQSAAQIACCSTYHFQRMFSYITGISLSEYIRHRRMSAAAFDLQDENAKISEIAAKYGYQSPTAFNRAFQSIHGVPPSAVWIQNAFLTTYPRIRFQVSVIGEENIKYKIETKDPIRIVGMKTRLKTNMDFNFKTIPDFWQRIKNSQDFHEMISIKDGEPLGILGVSSYYGPDDFYYYIGVASSLPAPSHMEICTVPAQTWAVFECIGPARLTCQKAYRIFFAQWLAVSNYKYCAGYDMEVYPVGDTESPNYRFELWLPVQKK